jgi:CheY-like chemotaxis protein
MKILFIEDVPEFSEIVTEILSTRGHSVTLIDNADDAIRAVPRASDWELVILDLMMRLGSLIPPGEVKETGIAIYRRLRSTHKDLNILILTALAKPDVWDNFTDDPHTRYFQKPLYPDKTLFFQNVEVWL